MLRLALWIVLGIPLLPPAVQAADWRQVGWFRSDSRNLSVADTLVRVVSAVDIQRLALKGDNFTEDSAILARFYPGWDYRSDLVVYYRPVAGGFVQTSFAYELGVERTALPGDTIAAHLGIYDHAGTRTVNVPSPLRAFLADTARVVAARACNWDADADPEWLVVTAGPPGANGRMRPQSLRLYNRSGDAWTPERTLEIRDPVSTGPLELRDVTGDGEPDFVYRYFGESLGHFWVDVRILSRHEGFAAVTSPAVFQPTGSPGPLR
jgi:hypothetical protein